MKHSNQEEFSAKKRFLLIDDPWTNYCYENNLITFDNLAEIGNIHEITAKIRIKYINSKHGISEEKLENLYRTDNQKFFLLTGSKADYCYENDLLNFNYLINDRNAYNIIKIEYFSHKHLLNKNILALLSHNNPNKFNALTSDMADYCYENELLNFAEISNMRNADDINNMVKIAYFSGKYGIAKDYLQKLFDSDHRKFTALTKNMAEYCYEFNLLNIEDMAPIEDYNDINNAVKIKYFAHKYELNENDLRNLLENYVNKFDALTTSMAEYCYHYGLFNWDIVPENDADYIRNTIKLKYFSHQYEFDDTILEDLLDNEKPKFDLLIHPYITPCYKNDSLTIDSLYKLSNKLTDTQITYLNGINNTKELLENLCDFENKLQNKNLLKAFIPTCLGTIALGYITTQLDSHFVEAAVIWKICDVGVNILFSENKNIRLTNAIDIVLSASSYFALNQCYSNPLINVSAIGSIGLIMETVERSISEDIIDKNIVNFKW